MYTMDTIHMDIADFDFEDVADLTEQALDRVGQTAAEADVDVLTELDLINFETGEIRVNVGGWDTEVSGFRRHWFEEC